MQSLRSMILSLACAAWLAGFYAPLIHAKAVGQLPTLNHMGEQMLASQGMTSDDLLQRVPSVEMVGMPVYPGALYTGEILAEGMLPSVVLASPDSIQQVRAWYAGQKGLSWDDTFRLFYRGGEYVLMESESVLLQDISGRPASSAGGLMFDMNGMKTQITISYQPKSGENND